MTANMILTVGLPASGKTTWTMDQVRAIGAVNVNRDDIRQMVCGGWTGKPEDEAMVTQIQHAAIVSGLKKQQTVIVSDTNLNRGIVKGLVKIAQNWGAKVSFVYFDTPMVECVIRDERRGERGERAVGEKVIRDMSRRYGNPNFDDLIVEGSQRVKYVPDISKPNAIIVDLDGTVALHNRSPYDYDMLHTDDPYEAVVRCVKNEYGESNYTHILFTSGRPDSHYVETVHWLEKHMQIYPSIPQWRDSEGNRRAGRNGMERVQLFMRKAEDKRMDAIVKYEIFDEKIRNNYNVLYAFDDRDQVVDLWRSINIPTFQVNYGAF